MQRTSSGRTRRSPRASGRRSLGGTDRSTWESFSISESRESFGDQKRRRMVVESNRLEGPNRNYRRKKSNVLAETRGALKLRRQLLRLRDESWLRQRNAVGASARLVVPGGFAEFSRYLLCSTTFMSFWYLLVVYQKCSVRLVV